MKSSFFTILIATSIWSFMAFGDRAICDHVIVKEGRIKLDKNEKTLICGTPKGVEGWREVPLPQAQYQLNVLLQNLGYLSARFERAGDTLNVWVGRRKTTQTLEVHGADGLLQAGKKRKIIGFPMEPSKLDEVQHWAELGLRRQGYACPIIKVIGQQWDDKVVVNIQTGERQTIESFVQTGLAGLDPATIARFQAFQVGQTYDVIATDLTTSRMLDQGLFQSAYITNTCKGDQADLQLFTSVGKPRLFRFGFGASTEEFPFADIWFKNTKLDNHASSFTTTLHGSNRLQSFTMDSELYILPFTKRTFLGPRFNLGRDKEDAYESFEVKAGVDLGRAWDAFEKRFQLRVGPTFNYVNTAEGVGLKGKFISWEASLQTMTHIYEEFTRDQYEGWTGSLAYKAQRQGVGSSSNVDRYQVDFKHLWNLGAYSPPLFVLATRVEGVVLNSSSDLSQLPTDYRIYYGGDDNLRGFSRQSLNNNMLGYSTGAYIGFELRLIEELPYHLQPFLLYDAARLGSYRFELDHGIFVSPGLGLRWASPFGTLRASAAKGRIYRENDLTRGIAQEWNYFLSFGQEF